MASKTSSSVGMMVFLAIVSVLALGMFVTTIIFFARTQRLANEVSLRQTDLDAAVRSDERDDRWEELKRSAGNRQGVVRYLDTSLRDLTVLVSGSRRDDAAALLEKVQAAAGANQTPLLTLIKGLQEDVASLQRQVADAESARDAARSDLLAATDRIDAMAAEHASTVRRMTDEIDSYKSGTNAYRTGLETTKTDMESRVTTIRSEADSTISGLEAQVGRLEQDLLIANDQLRKLRVDRSEESLSAPFEGALVDGRVVGVNVAARHAYLDIGRKNRVVLGMTFEVYNSGSTIRPDNDGNYPRGKGSLEVIRIDEASCVARIISENSGSPILSGDVIANAVYDPNKVYSFVVYGNFDTDGDGSATSLEAQNIRGLIESWNGKLTDDITGDTDFLVLGEKPILPPQPKPTDPVALTERYILLRQQVTRYDQLFERAVQAGIPILNQNRLYTLTGAGR